MSTEEYDPLLILTGSGQTLWSDEHADEYVQRLRDDWDEPDLLLEGSTR